MPNTSGTSASVTRAMRSASQSRRGGGVASLPPRRSRRGTRPVALSAAITQARKSSVVTASPTRPRSAIVCGIHPCACWVTDASVRCRSRAFSNAPAPTPSSGRSSNTRNASRQYLPRDDDAANTRPPPSPGDTCVSLVSSSMRSPMPRSLKATDVKAASGTRHATVTATMPIRLRSRADGARRSAPASTAAPNRIRSTIISSTRVPKSAATTSLALSGWKAFVKGSFESAHTLTSSARAERQQQHRQAAQPQRHQDEPCRPRPPPPPPPHRATA